MCKISVDGKGRYSLIILLVGLFSILFISPNVIADVEYIENDNLGIGGSIYGGDHRDSIISISSGEGLYFDWRTQSGENLTIYFDSQLIKESSFGDYTFHADLGGTHNISIFNNGTEVVYYSMGINKIKFTDYISHTSLTVEFQGYPRNIPGIFYIFISIWFVSLIFCLISPKLRGFLILIGIFFAICCSSIVYLYGNQIDENSTAIIGAIGGGDGGVVINAEIDFTQSDPITMSVYVEIYNNTNNIVFNGSINVTSYNANTESAFGFIRLPKGQYRVEVSANDRFKIDVREWSMLSEMGPSSWLWSVPFRWFFIPFNLFVIVESIVVFIKKLSHKKDKATMSTDQNFITTHNINNVADNYEMDNNSNNSNNLPSNLPKEMSEVLQTFNKLNPDSKIEITSYYDGAARKLIKICPQCKSENPSDTNNCLKCNSKLNET